jgi:AraC-like DNA-binding protein
MPFNTFQPNSEFLKNFIAYYYTDGSNDSGYRNSYIFYPHIYTTLSFYKNAVCQFDATSTIITYDKKVKYLKIVTHQTLPRCSTQIGKTNKLAVAFKPLGLNRFITEKYSEIVAAEAQLFSPQNNAQWEAMLGQVFSEKTVEHKIQILDSFLLRQYNDYENTILEHALAMLSDVGSDLSIDEIAKQVNVSRKTLLRYFKSELRITPELFRMIVRFRYAINEKIIKDSPETLTRIAYEANFFDQAYFIKRFKQLTGVTPSQFFKAGTRLGQEDTFWTFDSKNI